MLLDNNFTTLTTPEGVTFRLPLAGLTARGLAIIVDLFIIMVLNSIFISFIQITAIISTDLTGFLSILGSFLISAGYTIAAESIYSGQTYGKMLFHLRVIDTQGHPLSFYQIVIRNLLRVIDMLPIFYLTGFVCCLFSKKLQRFGDLAASTIVIDAKSITLDYRQHVSQKRYNSLLYAPHICSRIKNGMHPHMVAIIASALERKDEFDPAARIQIFAEIAELIKKMGTVPKEYYEDIPDESFAENVLELFYQN